MATNHYTHWNVVPRVRNYAAEVKRLYKVSWNTYFDHPPGYGLDAVSVDYWAPAGRGAVLSERVGDQVALHCLGMHPVRPIRWLIWWGFIWEPKTGWRPYSGWMGDHKDHVHVTYA